MTSLVVLPPSIDRVAHSHISEHLDVPMRLRGDLVVAAQRISEQQDEIEALRQENARLCSKWDGLFPALACVACFVAGALWPVWMR